MRHLRNTCKIGSVRSIHTTPALGAFLQYEHCGGGSRTALQRRPEFVHDKQDTLLRHHAVQRKAAQGVPERTYSGTIRWSFARTPRNLRSIPRRVNVPCPNRGHSR